MGAPDETTKNIYECDVCNFRYHPAKFGGVDLDDQSDWECPDCQAGPDHFHIVVPPSDDLVERNESDGSDGSDDEDDAIPLSADKRAIYRDKSEPTVAGLKQKHDRGR